MSHFTTGINLRLIVSDWHWTLVEQHPSSSLPSLRCQHFYESLLSWLLNSETFPAFAALHQVLWSPTEARGQAKPWSNKRPTCLPSLPLGHNSAYRDFSTPVFRSQPPNRGHSCPSCWASVAAGTFSNSKLFCWHLFSLCCLWLPSDGSAEQWKLFLLAESRQSNLASGFLCRNTFDACASQRDFENHGFQCQALYSVLEYCCTKRPHRYSSCDLELFSLQRATCLAKCRTFLQPQIASRQRWHGRVQPTIRLLQKWRRSEECCGRDVTLQPNWCLSPSRMHDLHQ